MRALVRIQMITAAVLCAGVVGVFPECAMAASVAPSSSPTSPYALDFTLPTQSKAGCMVCHGDENLIRLKAGKTVSYYVDGDAYATSTHGKEQCVACHLDFAYKAPHEQDPDWQSTAKMACKNCHEEQFIAYGKGVHRRAIDATGAAAAIEKTKPLCGDCHGSHDIVTVTDSPEGQAWMHDNGWQICGRCHQDYWDNYDDYYHGAAYKSGADDAPACWTCHGWHDILPSTDKGSPVNEVHLAETCGQNGCHKVSELDAAYLDYAYAIHGKRAVAEKNPLHRFARNVLGAIGGLFGGD
ncbi:MAG: hypothetical protein ABFC80_05100 [Coriobacteriales bacterium]